MHATIHQERGTEDLQRPHQILLSPVRKPNVKRLLNGWTDADTKGSYCIFLIHTFVRFEGRAVLSMRFFCPLRANLLGHVSGPEGLPGIASGKQGSHSFLNI